MTVANLMALEAYLITPDDIGAARVGFENHWNVFHCARMGLDRTLAAGLTCFLNSTALDDYFRVFSGHTQVNATDLRNMKYPDLDRLILLGQRFRRDMTQEGIDCLVAAL